VSLQKKRESPASAGLPSLSKSFPRKIESRDAEAEERVEPWQHWGDS
jgi:hypothetical protein